MSTAGFWPSSWENWWWAWAWRIYRFYRAGMRVRSKWLKCSESYNAQNVAMSQHLSTNCGSASASIACFPHCIFCCEVAADSSSIGWVPHSRNLKWIIQRKEPVGLSYPPLWPCLGWKRGDDHETREADDNRLRRKEPHWQDDSNPCIPPASVSQCPPLVSHRSLPSSSLTLAALSLLTPLLTTRVDRREPEKGRGGWPRERRKWGAEVGWTGGERCEQRNTWCEGPAHRPTRLHPLRSFSRHTRSLSSFPSSCSTHIWTNTFLYALMRWNDVKCCSCLHPHKIWVDFPIYHAVLHMLKINSLWEGLLEPAWRSCASARQVAEVRHSADSTLKFGCRAASQWFVVFWKVSNGYFWWLNHVKSC